MISRTSSYAESMSVYPNPFTEKATLMLDDQIIARKLIKMK
jgi:hypothetical protein